jgi:hypothetical protein
MSAYNWILIHASCPACHKESEIKCQAHMVSSFDGNDTGRFCNATYRLGDQMRWWAASDYRYNNWRDETNSTTALKADDTASECCYSECSNCKEELFAVIRFTSCVPEAVLSVGLGDNWPEGYYK